MKSIVPEVKQFRSSALDLDKLRNVYNQTFQGISVNYPGYEITAIEGNLFTLLYRSIKVDFISKWTMRPDYVSYEYYNTVIYWPFIMIVNNIDSFEEFKNLDGVIIPNIQDIIAVARFAIERDEVINVDLEDEVPYVNKFYKRFPLDEIESIRIRSEDDLIPTVIEPTTCVLREKIDTFILSSSDITNKYVDLTFPPFNVNSINLLINQFVSAQIYGYDFSIIANNDNNVVRITWDGSDVELGDGMTDLLEAANTLTITYLYNELGCNVCEPAQYDVLDGGAV